MALPFFKRNLSEAFFHAVMESSVINAGSCVRSSVAHEDQELAGRYLLHVRLPFRLSAVKELILLDD